MKNKRGLITILTLFVSVALVSVGFATWVITGEGSQTGNGSIEVTSVVDKRIGVSDLEFVTATGETLGAKKNISFLGSRAKQDGDWLHVEEGENLTVYLKGTVTAESEAFIDKDPIVTLGVFKSGEDASSIYGALQKFDDPNDSLSTTVELVKALPTEANGGIVATIGANTSDSKFEAPLNIKITFAWGDAFGGDNPQDYYNTDKTSAEYADEALARLNAIYTLNELTYKVSVAIKNPTE